MTSQMVVRLGDFVPPASLLASWSPWWSHMFGVWCVGMTQRERCGAARPHGWIRLNVGGRIYETHVDTLTAVPSRLREAALDDFETFPRDTNGIPFVDRDGRNFRHILNFLRGYSVQLPSEEVEWVAEDAKYFGLHCMLDKIGVSSPEEWRFAPHAGMTDGTTLTSSIVNAIATVPKTSGRYSVVVRIDRCETIGVGVTATLPPAQPLMGSPFSACYLHTGDIGVNPYSTLGVDTAAVAPRFEDGDSVGCSITVAPDGGLVEFFRQGTKVFTTEFSAGQALYFVVTLRGASAATLVHTEAVAT